MDQVTMPLYEVPWSPSNIQSPTGDITAETLSIEGRQQQIVGETLPASLDCRPKKYRVTTIRMVSWVAVSGNTKGRRQPLILPAARQSMTSLGSMEGCSTQLRYLHAVINTSLRALFNKQPVDRCSLCVLRANLFMPFFDYFLKYALLWHLMFFVNPGGNKIPWHRILRF